MKMDVEYFQFEQDFLEDNIRCIPMIVRFKLDAVGIKLKLKEWSKMSVDEREQLAISSIETNDELNAYREYLEQVIVNHSGTKPSVLLPERQNFSWTVIDHLPSQLVDKLAEEKMELTLDQWKSLSVLKRFALLKLTRPGHENKNFPKAMKEFGLV